MATSHHFSGCYGVYSRVDSYANEMCVKEDRESEWIGSREQIKAVERSQHTHLADDRYMMKRLSENKMFISDQTWKESSNMGDLAEVL